MTTATDLPKRKRGRPPIPGKLDPMHRARPDVARNKPVHVILRSTETRLHQKRVLAELREVVALYDERDDFHVDQLHVERDHLHLVVRADDRERLSRGMQGFTIRAARAIHRALDTDGKIWTYRYQATPITRAQAKQPLACDCD